MPSVCNWSRETIRRSSEVMWTATSEDEHSAINREENEPKAI